MFNLVLVEPEIPPYTGNIARLALAAGCRLTRKTPLVFPDLHAGFGNPGWGCEYGVRRPADCRTAVLLQTLDLVISRVADHYRP